MVFSGQTSEVLSLSTIRKEPSVRYDATGRVAITQNFGSSYAIADVSGDVESSVSLLSIVANTPYSSGAPGSNNGSSPWNNGFKTFSATSSGGYFTQSYIKIWHSDSSDGNDYVVFSAGPNSHGDWSGIGNVGAVGAEFRMGGNYSDTDTIQFGFDK